jgi:hypothetical protein
MRVLIASHAAEGTQGCLIQTKSGIIFFKVRIWFPAASQFSALKDSVDWHSIMNMKNPRSLPVVILKNFIFAKVMNNERSRILSSQSNGYRKSEVVLVGHIRGSNGGSLNLVEPKHIEFPREELV